MYLNLETYFDSLEVGFADACDPVREGPRFLPGPFPLGLQGFSPSGKERTIVLADCCLQTQIREAEFSPVFVLFAVAS